MDKKAIYIVLNVFLCMGCIGLLFVFGPDPEDMQAGMLAEKTLVAEEEQKMDETEPAEQETASVEALVVSDNQILLSKQVVYLDAGHGGSDAGVSARVTAYGQNTDLDQGRRLVEKELAFSVAKRVGQILTEKNIQVVYLREMDVALSAAQRMQLCEDENALLVSFHVGEAFDSQIHGMEILANEKAGQVISEDGLLLFTQALQKKTLEDAWIGQTHAQPEKLFTDTKNPCLQITLGFLSNAQERRLLTKEDYKQNMAEGISDGICLLLAE